MASQLRIYDITSGDLEHIAERVREDIFPLCRDHGFDIDGPWINREANQYIWIIHFDGEGTFEEAVERYYADPRRDALDFKPRDFIVEADLRMVERT